MIEDIIAQTKRRTAWSACPNCLLDLRARSFHGKRLYSRCPFCGIQLNHIWWQRVLIKTVALILAYGVPALIGVRGLLLLFAGLVCIYPALVLAIILVLNIIPSKYIRESEVVITLFRR